MQQVYNLIAEVEFNRPEDREQFAKGDKIVSLNCFTDSDETPVIGLCFDLGADPDDRISLIFPLEELMAKLVKAIYEAEH